MFIQTKQGTDLINLEKAIKISVKSKTEEMKSLHPVLRGEIYAIQVVMEKADDKDPIVLAYYDNKEEAIEIVCKICAALGDHATVCTLYAPDDDNSGKAEPERDIESEPDLDKEGW